VEAHTIVRRRDANILVENRLTDGGDYVGFTLLSRPPFKPRRLLVLISVRGSIDTRDIVWLKELDQFRIPVTISGNY
jgi:hypothetical protein